MTSTPSKKNKRTLQKVITKYRYLCDSKIGHGINRPLPKLIKLPKASDLCETIVLIAFLLLEIINIESKKIAIIHLDKNEPDWFQLLFKVKVLLVLDADEYHLKQFIPEAMARCMNNLAILVRPKPKENLKSDEVKDLVHHWEVSNETGKPALDILSLKVCSGYAFKKHENYNETQCKVEKTKYSSYKIHKKYERYKNLSKIIQLSYRSLHLDYKKISKEAVAM